MAFYNEIFIEDDGVLIHLGSCKGSDTPCYFQDVKTLEDWDNALKDLAEENGFWPHNKEKHPFPGKSYKTSDNLIVLRRTKKKWFEVWKPTYEVWVSADKYDEFVANEEHRSYFVHIDNWFLGDEGFNDSDRVALDLPRIPSLVKTV